MKTLQVLLLVVIAIVLFTALLISPYRNDPKTPLGSNDTICYPIDSIALVKWTKDGQNLVVFPVKKTAGLKEDFDLAFRTLKESFLVGGKPVTEKEFRELAGNYVLYLKKNGVDQSQVAPGYVLDKKKRGTICIYLKSQIMVSRNYNSLPGRDTVCCRCPPVCGDLQFQKVVGDVIQKQYK